MAEDDDAVETVVYECQQAAKQPRKFFHRSSSSLALELASRASDRGPLEVKTHDSRIMPRLARTAQRVYRPRSGGRAEISNIFG
jgi:hypothetical protein